MNSAPLQVRRATVDDFDALKIIWASMRLPADELEKRLTEFQVVENSSGEIVGAIGIQISKQHALLHSEGYSDFSVADPARNLFWERIQILASNHGVFRLWTRENSPLWKSFGFQPPTAEALTRLPDEWKTESDGKNEGGWLTFQLKNEEVINAMFEKEFTAFTAAEKKEISRITGQAQTIKTIVTVFAFGIAILCFGVLIWLFIHQNPFAR
jgi:N-acetylglutamate synthase-like GNAT family acetyltransferase